MSDVLLSLIAAECKTACANEPDVTERLKKSMRKVASGHWMGGNEDVWLRGAIGGVLLSDETTDDDAARIKQSLEEMRALSAMLSGVPVDMEGLSALIDRRDDTEPLQLMKIWDDVKAESQ